MCSGAAGVLLVAAGPAWAYLDPGTGSYLFQMLVAAVLGAAFTLRMYWRRIVSSMKELLSRRRE